MSDIEIYSFVFVLAMFFALSYRKVPNSCTRR